MSNDADYLTDRSRTDPRQAVDALFRGDAGEAIYISSETAIRHYTQAMANMRAPAFLH